MTHKELLDRAREIIAEWEDPTIFRPAIAMNDPDEVQLARAVRLFTFTITTTTCLHSQRRS